MPEESGPAPLPRDALGNRINRDHNPTTGVVTPTLGREGTLTAFYGDPRTWWVSLTHDF